MGTLNVLMCVKVSDLPHPPKDQEDCKKVGCTWCKVLVWLSKKKRAVIANTKDSLILCPACAANLAVASPVGVDTQDLAEPGAYGKIVGH